MTFELPMRPRHMPKLLPNIRGYILQPKFNGWYVVFRDGVPYTRTGEDLSDWQCWRGRALPKNAVGELMHRDGRNAISRLANTRDGLQVVLFDIPGRERLEERLDMMPDVAERHRFEWAMSYTVDNWKEANGLLERLQADGAEGIVIKRKGSPWVCGDSREWYRFKAPVAVPAYSSGK